MQAGDRGAFAALYDLCARGLFLDLVGRLGSREDAEDALQASFLTAWHRRGTLASPDRFMGWLFRIGRNKAVDLLRKRLRAPGRLEDADLILAPALSPGSDGELARALHGLKPESRSLLLLRAVHGWDAHEVAAAWSTSPSTIRRRYARLLDHLRTYLARERDHA